MTIEDGTETASAGPPRKSLYESSTQFQNWRYSPEQLNQIRTSLNAGAVDAIRRTIEADEPGSSLNVSFLIPPEEHLLVKLYVSKIAQLCGHFRFPEEVEATAVSYLKRFYLKNTVMDWHPKNVMLTALFLATKTTNNPISLEAYTSNIPKTSPSDVLDLEFLVAQSLGFEFAVWHAHRALWGMWLDLQSIQETSMDRSQTLFNAAMAHVRVARLTDAELVYTPSQIALACLSLANPATASQWVSSKCLPDAAVLYATIDAVKDLITQTGQVPDVESVREVDRRLKLCKNPEKVVGSKAYLAKKAAEERKAEEKRNRKAMDVKKVMEDRDPFGEELLGEKEQTTVADDDDDEDD